MLQTSMKPTMELHRSLLFSNFATQAPNSKASKKLVKTDQKFGVGADNALALRIAKPCEKKLIRQRLDENPMTIEGQKAEIAHTSCRKVRFTEGGGHLVSQFLVETHSLLLYKPTSISLVWSHFLSIRCNYL